MRTETRKGHAGLDADKPAGSLAAYVREHDRDRYQTALFAPAGRREALFALYAFNYEIARVRETVTQPMLGQIRLQWWREVIDAAHAGTRAREHFVAQPLVAAIREYSLSREWFDRMIDARERDLADEAPATLGELEEYCGATGGGLACLALEVLGEAALPAREAAQEIGMAYALTGLLRAMPFHARTGRCYIPTELVECAGLAPADYASLRATAPLRSATRAIAESAAVHLQAARRLRSEIPRAARSVMLSAIVVDRFLTRLARAGYDPFAPRLAQPDTLQGWRLFAAALCGRF